MRAMGYLVLVVAAAAVALAGCESAGPHGRTLGNTAPRLTPEAASAAGLSPEQSSAAVQLYTAKCLRCHKAYDPAAYSEEQWQSWMSKMSKKARLTPEQSDLLAHYLDAYRAASAATPKEPR
jgi:cytochrome c5